MDTFTAPIPSLGPKPHQGMPPLDQSGAPLSFFEFWPMWAFYPPVFVYVLWLMVRYRGVLLPTVANPSFPGGGFFGESKAEILDLAVTHAPDWVAQFVTIDRPDFERDRQTLGCRGAGVRLVRTEEALRDYLSAFPAGARLLLQRYVAFEGEAGVFYCRHPDEPTGRVPSITLKYFPYVHGDGVRTLRELILADPRAGRLAHLYLPRHAARLDSVPARDEPVRLAFAGSHSRGAIFRNGTDLVTPAMAARFDMIAKSIPEFYFGRFDIRFEDFAKVQQGEGFTIVEANGAGAESTHIWDRKTNLLTAWADLMKQYRLLFQIGRANLDRGFKPLTIAQFRQWHRREKTLTPLYPSTD
jgi:hypothetical protein